MGAPFYGRINVGWRARLATRFSTLYSGEELHESRSRAIREAAEWGESHYGTEVFRAMLKQRAVTLFAIPTYEKDPNQTTLPL